MARQRRWAGFDLWHLQAGLGGVAAEAAWWRRIDGGTGGADRCSCGMVAEHDATGLTAGGAASGTSASKSWEHELVLGLPTTVRYRAGLGSSFHFLLSIFFLSPFAPCRAFLSYVFFFFEIWPSHLFISLIFGSSVSFSPLLSLVQRCTAVRIGRVVAAVGFTGLSGPNGSSRGMMAAWLGWRFCEFDEL
ncbi:hypothetical protein M0R45_026086 [Rubus argutus]|uniref:Uncharacterized protein n=1 Tax=Rubus argutus TaxID=59490 RepID=A0AAW1WY47_RUBAR